MLKKEYEFLRKKYHLKKIYDACAFPADEAGEFPLYPFVTAGSVLRSIDRLVCLDIECENLSQIRKKLTVRANDYWH